MCPVSVCLIIYQFTFRFHCHCPRLLEVLCQLEETSPTLRRVLASTAQNYFTRDWQSALGREKGAAFYTQVSCRARYTADKV
jgi:hypothetical protein